MEFLVVLLNVHMYHFFPFLFLSLSHFQLHSTTHMLMCLLLCVCSAPCLFLSFLLAIYILYNNTWKFLLCFCSWLVANVQFHCVGILILSSFCGTDSLKPCFPSCSLFLHHQMPKPSLPNILFPDCPFCSFYLLHYILCNMNMDTNKKSCSATETSMLYSYSSLSLVIYKVSSLSPIHRPPLSPSPLPPSPPFYFPFIFFPFIFSLEWLGLVLGYFLAAFLACLVSGWPGLRLSVFTIYLLDHHHQKQQNREE